MNMSVVNALKARGKGGTDVSLSAAASSLGIDGGVSVSKLILRLLEFRVVAVGDSVMWGQGLSTANKTSYIVAAGIQSRFPKLTVKVFNYSHSGAIVGDINSANQGTSPDFEEVPDDQPTLFGQVFAAEQELGRSADLILVCGGINDINFRTIIDPFGPDIAALCKMVCRVNVSAFLSHTSSRFPTARIVCHGYFKLLSKESSLWNTTTVLFALEAIVGFGVLTALVGVGVALTVPILLEIIRGRCEDFYYSFQAQLEAVCSEIPRVTFVPSTWSDANSLFASKPFLSGVNEDLSLQDDPTIRVLRAKQCQQKAPNDSTCPMASIGHPNAQGAAKTAKAILEKVS